MYKYSVRTSQRTYCTSIRNIHSLILYKEAIVVRSVHKSVKSNYQLRHVCPSVRPSVCMELLVSHWMNFHEI